MKELLNATSAVADDAGTDSTPVESSAFRLFIVAGLTIAAASLVTAFRLRAMFPDLFKMTVFDHQFLRYEEPAALLTVVVVAAAVVLMALVRSEWVESSLRWTAAHPGVWALVTLFATALSALTVHRASPLTLDEYAPYFQSQLFARGRLVAEYPSEWVERLFPEFFRLMFFDGSVATGRVISSYWPSFALMLTPFSALGVPWLLNPILSALSVLGVHRLARRISEDPLAPGWAVLLFVATNAFVVNGATFYSMPAHLFLNLLYVLLLLEPTPRRLVWAGVVGSIALTLHNPVPHTAFAAPWIIALWRSPRGWRDLGLLAAGYLPLTLLLGFGWLFVRRSIYADGGQASDPVFDAHFADVAGHSFSMPNSRILAVRFMGLLKLCLWAVPGLPLLAILGTERAWANRSVRLLAWSAISTLLAYCVVRFDQGHGWGYRYFHSALFTLPLLSTFALSGRSPGVDRLRRLVWVLALVCLTGGSAFRLYQVDDFFTGHLDQLPNVEVQGRQVCFVAIDDHYAIQEVIQNDPFLRNQRLYLLSHGRDADAAFVRQHFREPALVFEADGHSIWQVKERADE